MVGLMVGSFACGWLADRIGDAIIEHHDADHPQGHPHNIRISEYHNITISGRRKTFMLSAILSSTAGIVFFCFLLCFLLFLQVLWGLSCRNSFLTHSLGFSCKFKTLQCCMIIFTQTRDWDWGEGDLHVGLCPLCGDCRNQVLGRDA